MAKLTAAQRRAMPQSDYALSGKRKYITGLANRADHLS